VYFETPDEGYNPNINDNTGFFIMFSVITNIYNKKTKGPTLNEFFTVTIKMNFFLTTRDVRCVKNSIKVGPLVFSYKCL